jgi:hypothetical protein
MLGLINRQPNLRIALFIAALSKQQCALLAGSLRHFCFKLRVNTWPLRKASVNYSGGA